MIPVIRKILKFCLYAIVVIIGVVFCVSNRSHIELTLFPLPYALTIPVFLFAIILFITGLLAGRTVGAVKHVKTRKQYKAANERVSALENEVTAVRSHQLIKG